MRVTPPSWGGARPQVLSRLAGAATRSSVPTTATGSLASYPAARLAARLVPVIRWGSALTVVVSAGVAAEAVWTVRRRLPALVGSDASGMVPGRTPGRPLRLVALGDSSLTGPGIGDADRIWLRRALRRLELDRDVEVISLAVGGSRVADVARRVDDAIALDPDLVTVAVGSNDVIRATPSRQLRVQLDGVVARLVDAVGVVAVANVGDLGNVARIPPPLESVMRARSRTARRVIERVVDAHPGAILLDVSRADRAFRDRSVFAPDLFHPGEVGHALWAEAVLPDLRAAVAAAEQVAPRRTGPEPDHA